MKKVLTCCFIFIVSFSIFAENSTANDSSVSEYPYKKAIGLYALAAGADGIAGLQYQQWGKSIGWQGLFSVFYDPDRDWSGTVLDYSLILDGQYLLYENSYKNNISGRLYVWGSVGHRGTITTIYTFLQDDSRKIEEEYEEKISFNALVGFGFGIEALLYRNFSFPIQFGYYASFPTNPIINFSVGTGLRYRF